MVPYRAALNRFCFVVTLAAMSTVASGSYGNTVVFPDDPLAVQSTFDQPGWVKFTILVSDPSTVYFQDSNQYSFHYDFAVAELPHFFGMSRAEFDNRTLYAQGQEAILGTVILPPLVGFNHVYQEYGIQLVRQDAYSGTEVRDHFNTVKAAIIADPQVEAFYFPTFEQQAAAEQDRAFLESEGIPISSVARWASGNSCYSDGWGIGPLKYFPADQIEAAHLAGNLLPTDLLLTDAVPAEIPFVAGVLSLGPSTPNSHVALLAQTFSVPFAHLALAGDAQRAQDLVGHSVALVAYAGFGFCKVKLIDLDGQLDQATIDEILALKEPPPLNIAAIQPLGGYSTSTDGLQLADVQYYGGKASNFGVLRRAIPLNSPVSTAFSFDLWTEFMDQVLANQNTLRQEIALRLSPFSYPPDMGQLSTVLTGIQDLIEDPLQTVFPAAGHDAVLFTLQDAQYGFDASRKLRFRSSTNVEDTDRFTGAGLYDSFNGCLADDLDGDDSGPSACDPGQSSERSVFRAIRKVYASFYNLNAYLERLRHGIDENDVGMALLVHHSFPDEDELANGVGKMRQLSTTTRDAYLVSQLGDSSVTNPEPGAIAEEVDVWISGGGTIYPTLIRPSNLVTVGATVMEFTQDYVDLTALLRDATVLYSGESGLTQFTVEFEYKKIAPDDRLVVKQIRRLPQPDNADSVTPFLINEPLEYCLFQGEYGDVFANHRLKSRWTVETGNLWLSEANLQSSFFAECSMQYAEVCQLYAHGGPLPQWPQATHQFTAGDTIDSFVLGSLQNPRTYHLEVLDVPTLVAPSESPLFTLSDLGIGGCIALEVDYAMPVPSTDWTGAQIMVSTDYARLCECPVPQVGDMLQTRQVSQDGVTVTTRFYWPPEPTGIVAGYTAPLARFLQTTITGLTAAPIVLADEYSQTYRPEHHNFAESFIFEPALEPDLPQQQRDELDVLGARVIHVDPSNTITYYDDAGWTDSCLACDGFDADDDGHCTADAEPDCDDGQPQAWAVPGTIQGLLFADEETLTWRAPALPGAAVVNFELLRSSTPTGFGGSPTCIPQADPTLTTATDPTIPGAGGLLHYLVRATNACPAGDGPVGDDSSGSPRPAAACL